MNWGPLPKFTHQLAQLGPGLKRGRSVWFVAVEQIDHLWDEYVFLHPSLWPAALPPLPTAESTEKFGLVRFLLKFSKRGATTPPNQRTNHESTISPIIYTLMECQVWLVNRSVNILSHLFLPLASEPPGKQNKSHWIDLTLVSKQAVKWALYLYALDQYGISSVHRYHFHPKDDDQGTQADLIALHLLIEDFVAAIPKRINRFTPSECKRTLGGLRTHSFLTNYPHIRIHAPAWEQALDPFIAQSHLTQLVYADLIFSGDPQWFTLTHFADGNRAWRDLWYTHLARSLLGALLSKPINWELCDSAQQKLNQIDEAATRWANKEPFFFFQKPHNKEHYPGLQAARRHYRQCREELTIQYTQRIAQVARAFQQASPNLIYLQIRLIDILLRHIVTLATPAMHQEWRNICQKEVSPRPGVDLFEPTRIAYQTFENILFGRRLSEARSLLEPEQVAILREHCQQLLNMPNNWNDLILSEKTGVNSNAAEGLAARFGRVGIRLPMGEPDEHGPAPANLLTSNWYVHLIRQLDIELIS